MFYFCIWCTCTSKLFLYLVYMCYVCMWCIFTNIVFLYLVYIYKCTISLFLYMDKRTISVFNVRVPVYNFCIWCTSGVVLTQATAADGLRWSTSRSFLYPVLHRTNLHIVVNAHVTKVTESLSLIQCTLYISQWNTQDGLDLYAVSHNEIIGVAVICALYLTMKYPGWLWFVRCISQWNTWVGIQQLLIC